MIDARKKVLIVDDEPNIRSSLELLLKSNFDVSTAEDGLVALQIMEECPPDIVLLDLLMPRLDGLETLKRIKERNIATPIVMLTGSNTVKSAVQAMKSGATDYLSKPFDVEELTSLIVQILSVAPPSTSQRDLADEPSTERQILDGDFGPMVGKSPIMAELFKKVATIAERDTTVLITGESGTGKELVARRVHELSKRKNGPFVALNCAAIPETLIESELFGHEKGSFTSAVDRRLGYFELADKGTLFLDEIGELSPQIQVKMLRFLQEHEFHRVGRSKTVKVDVRIVCATNQNLEQLVKEKRFRQDLYYRINVINLTLTPLRDRFEDIEPLIHHFIAQFAPRYGGRSIQISPEALEVMVQYGWPGNVRELENTVESLLALAPNDLVTVEDLPRKLKQTPSTELGRHGVFQGDIKFEDAERMFESEMIVKALRKTNYVQTRAAELLGISRRILKYKMDKLGIKDTPPAGPPADAADAGGPGDGE